MGDGGSAAPRTGRKRRPEVGRGHARLQPSVGQAELAQVLEEAAHRVAEQGTSSERRLLEAMSEVAAQSAPGAAAALVDPDGSETSRLRAFGIVHTHLLEVLGPREHAWLLDLLDGAGGLESPRARPLMRSIGRHRPINAGGSATGTCAGPHDVSAIKPKAARLPPSYAASPRGARETA